MSACKEQDSTHMYMFKWELKYTYDYIYKFAYIVATRDGIKLYTVRAGHTEFEK